MTVHELIVRNPTNLSRPGFVTVPADKVRDGVDDGPVTVVDDEHKSNCRTQIDRLHQGDRSRDVVSVFIDHIPEHNQDTPESDKMYLSVKPYETSWEHEMSVTDEGDGKLLKNENLVVYIYPPVGPLGWQGGAITSVRLRQDGREYEILDPLKGEIGDKDHDPEKRLQLDRVSIANPPWSDEPATEFVLFDKSWRIAGSGAGPVRAFVNLESPEFKYQYGKSVHTCHLYRVISLFHGADFIHEQLYVLGTTPPGSKKPVDNFTFAAHFFLRMNCGMSRLITRVPQIPDWFAIGAVQEPYPGFGSASSVPCGRIDNPPLDYPNYKTEHAAFGWGLEFGREVRCIHLFKRRTAANIVADETGRRWYNVVLKPPRAKVERAG